MQPVTFSFHKIEDTVRLRTGSLTLHGVVLNFVYKCIQNPLSGSISVLDWDVQSSKYSRYSCGWPFQAALTLSPIEGFETTSISLSVAFH